MPAAVIRPGDLPLESETENPLTYKRLVRRENHGPDLSVTWISLRGRHRRIVCRESDRVYYILSGSASFNLGDASPPAGSPPPSSRPPALPARAASPMAARASGKTARSTG